jgi:hypothetical protein
MDKTIKSALGLPAVAGSTRSTFVTQWRKAQ